MFTRMAHLIPAGERGVARIEHVREDENVPGASPKEYFCQLWVDGKCVMNDYPPQERDINLPVIEAARGDVLIAGLGIGYILVPILAKPEVESVTVIEKCQDVIDLVLPHLTHPKLTVVLADAFDWTPPNSYDTMWFDIYPHDQQVGETLMTRYAPWLRSGGWARSIF